MYTGQSVLAIGAGLGGITTAALLAKQEYNVTVLEKNKRPGGRYIASHSRRGINSQFAVPEFFSRVKLD